MQFRMANVREKEAYLQLQRQKLADREFQFESERSAAVLMRQKSHPFVRFRTLSDMGYRYLSAEAIMSQAQALQVRSSQDE